MSKKYAVVYRKAAQLVEQGKMDYACNAISSVVAGGFMFNFKCDECTRFADLYGKSPTEGAYGWYGNPYGGGDSHNERRNQRLIALCFAAAMAETGDL